MAKHRKGSVPYVDKMALRDSALVGMARMPWTKRKKMLQ